jgi:mono/diheme cytochrome c family protein
MNLAYWERIHGGITHLPIVLLPASIVFDTIAWRSRQHALRRGLHAAGFGSAVAGVLGGVIAMIAGLVLTRGRMLGSGEETVHHLFVWPALILSALFVGWRLFIRESALPLKLGIYLIGMSLATVMMFGAGYSGGELLLAADKGDGSLAAATPPLPSASPSARMPLTDAGRKLFLKNCAHCHGADARGDEGPDLHNLDWTDEQIATRIRKGKKGQMTAFDGKLPDDDIRAVVAYLRTLK